MEALQTLYPEVLTKMGEGIDGMNDFNSDREHKYGLNDKDGSVTKAWSALRKELNQSISSSAMIGQLRFEASELTFNVHPQGEDQSPQSFTMPFSLQDASALYNLLQPSYLGVEGRGDVLDEKLRRSHEADVQLVSLPGPLATFDFPDEVERVRLHLCPSAVQLRVVPYKLVAYGQGDFFVPHRDSMNSADMLGTISVLLPVRGEEKPPKDAEEDSRRFRSWNEKRKGEPGQLLLYAGCHSSDASVFIYTSRGEAHSENDLNYAVDMESLCVPNQPTPNASSETDQSAKLILSYGAWTGDVLHEVRRLAEGYRFSLVYRVYKEGHRESFVPPSLRSSIEQQVVALVHRLQEFKEPSDSAGKMINQPHYLGFCLRHAYPPSALTPTTLKGIDAIVYNIVSNHFITYLFNGCASRPNDFETIHFFIPTPYGQLVFPTANVPELNFCGEEAMDQMNEAHPVMQRTVWVQLGYGKLLGGGFCYGNVDCGTDWWYRQAFLFVSATPSRWRQSRNLFLVLEHGEASWRQLKGKRDVIENILSFLLVSK